MKVMKIAALCLSVLALSACNPTFDHPPLLHAGAGATAGLAAPAVGA